MGVVLEFVLLFILIFGLVSGYKRGFIKSVARPVRFFASLATAFWLAKPVSRDYIEPFVSSLIKNPLTNQIKDHLVNNCPDITPTTASEQLPSLLRLAASYGKVDMETMSTTDTITEIVESLVSPVIGLVSVVITFILMYFVAKIAYAFLLSLVSSAFSKGIVGLPNRVLGSVFGLLLATVISWALVAIFGFVVDSSLFESAEWAQGFEGRAIYRFFAENSPIDILLSF